MKKFTTIIHLTLLAVALATAQIASAATILLVEEKFDGDNTALAGKTADFFDQAIIDAGGSASWSTGTAVFRRDGSVSTTELRSIHLNLGSYINATKGQENGLFELSVTISETAEAWLSVGFSIHNAPLFNGVFTTPNTDGIGTMAYRNTGEIAGWAGPRTSAGATGNTAAQSGNQKLTITLDLRNHNGTDNFGTVSFHASGPGDVFGTGTGWSGSTYSYQSDQDFGSILLSTNRSSGTYSDLTLSQIPEPGVALLGGLGLLMLLLRRRR